MRYRRNSDQELRDLERRYSQDPNVLPRLNLVRQRMGLGPITLLPPLAWGYKEGLLPTTPAAWGARAIFSNGIVDLPPDRQATQRLRPEDLTLLLQTLNYGALETARKEASRLYNVGILRPDEAKEVILYEDNGIVILANTKASGGYLYLVAFLETPEWQSKMPQCDNCGKERLKDFLPVCFICSKRICGDTCATLCHNCEEFSCNIHATSDYAPKCVSCENLICTSRQCSEQRTEAECPTCGRLYCFDCRGEVENCECQEEKWCDNCEEQIEECSECGDSRCNCDPCSCDDEGDYY